jgi:hypothetical protein
LPIISSANIGELRQELMTLIQKKAPIMGAFLSL